ncbi:MAG TPA: hypothetical protein VJQ79_13660, partial [Acidimicrobiia bacterium]|nr:hypothetical protein [Acidimicrobiia bacterium]
MVWTGSEMIVWGGEADEIASTLFSDGAAYDPAKDTWRLLSHSPLSGRRYHSAVWTGDEMLIVGGVGEGDGAAYHPDTDSWRPIAVPPVPLAPPAGTDTVGLVSFLWTGDQLIIWHVAPNQPVAYNPTDDAW